MEVYSSTISAVLARKVLASARARAPSAIQNDLFNAETSRTKSKGLTTPESSACCNDSPDLCVAIRNHETYANCLSKPALTDLKAIYASRSTFDLWYSIKDSSYGSDSSPAGSLNKTLHIGYHYLLAHNRVMMWRIKN